MDIPKVIKSKKGVKFHCISCGHCCSGESEGLVFVYREDVRRISTFLKLAEAIFLSSFCEVVDASFKEESVPTIVLKVDPITFNCIFQQPGGSCAIYPVRPFQCASFPFWAMNLADQAAWENVKKKCPGFRAKKKQFLYSLDDIQAFLDQEKQMEEEHYLMLKQNNFNLPALYPCLKNRDKKPNGKEPLDH